MKTTAKYMYIFKKYKYIFNHIDIFSTIPTWSGDIVDKVNKLMINREKLLLFITKHANLSHVFIFQSQDQHAAVASNIIFYIFSV